eukprot:TRINITY_DN7323_c0_g3_i1.p1 TRINITY_DN7323_c0_g3~~TRINITY_DN7323_c0_g3_i1.p1  ORF type:complete len:362 (+),score=89.00 TRINITY_DN7323_c0_g3_i1:25-1086(+)
MAAKKVAEAAKAAEDAAAATKKAEEAQAAADAAAAKKKAAERTAAEMAAKKVAEAAKAAEDAAAATKKAEEAQAAADAAAAKKKAAERTAAEMAAMKARAAAGFPTAKAVGAEEAAKDAAPTVKEEAQPLAADQAATKNAEAQPGLIRTEDLSGDGFTKAWAVKLADQPECSSMITALRNSTSWDDRAELFEKFGVRLVASSPVVSRLIKGEQVAAWNERHPEDSVSVGDVVLEASDECASTKHNAGSPTINVRFGRFTQHYTVEIRRDGRSLGLKFRKTIGSQDSVLTILDMLQDGAIGQHNQVHAAANQWDRLVIPGMLIVGVNAVDDDAREMTRLLRESEVVTLQLKRPF